MGEFRAYEEKEMEGVSACEDGQTAKYTSRYLKVSLAKGDGQEENVERERR